MRRNLLAKVLATGVIAFVLFVPLSMIRGTVQERHQLSAQVLQEIKGTGVAEQRVLGPILFVPYHKTTVHETVDGRTGAKSLTSTTEEGRIHFLPESLDVRAQVETETRQRGIYSALMFRAPHQITGAFNVPEELGVVPEPSTTYAWGDAYVVFGIKDTRGIRGTPSLNWNGASLPWAGGTRGPAIGSGIHAVVGAVAARRYAFSIGLELRGTEFMEYVPVGKETTVSMKAKWPHPSFVGQFLPETRTITARGFDAVWKTGHLASNIDGALAACLNDACGNELMSLGVSFIQPVNIYLQSERAAKYGFLFIALTFVVFLLFELLKKLAIHPVQYGLVGLGLAMFFLLLLALTEHVPFVIAYVVASGACIGLLGFYVSFVLRSVKRAAGFAGLLTTLYGALYILLQSEDMALLLGAALLFGILATIMVVTRRVDWYRTASTTPAEAEA